MSSVENKLFHAALEIQSFFEEAGWKFAFIGGLALLRWGRRRTTEDVDGTILTLFVDEEKTVDKILDRFESRVSDARNFALNNRVLLLTASNGIGADISMGGFPFEERMVERSSLFEYDRGFVLRTCSAEDLIVLKAFAARDKDWADVRSILERQRGKLDIDYVLDNLRLLAELKESPEIMDRLENMIRQINEQP